jgi:TetR/AcrR family transcriptional regulator, transcriptional repressor for nem operon
MPKVKLFNPNEALCKAKNIFWAKGFNATSMQDLIDGMNISRQSLYDTFGNKQDLFDQCLSNYQKEAIQMNCEILDSDKKTKEIIHDFFDYLILTIINDTQNKNCFIINTMIETIPENSEARHIVNKNFEELQLAIYNTLKKGKDNNDFSSPFTIDELTNHIITSMYGIKVIGKLKKDKKTLDNLVKTTMSVFN